MPTKRALLIGAVETTRIAFEAIARHPAWDMAAIVTLDPALAGRHSDHVDLRPAARERGCPVIHVDNINREESLSAIRDAGADIAFVMGWSQICGTAFRALFRDRVIGYHPAALPRLRGRAAIPWTILQQEPITAGTLFWIDAGTDTGDIVDQQYFHVAPDETAATLYAKHMRALAVMLDRALERIAAGEMPRMVQDESCATWAARRTPADGLIDWRRPAGDILRLIRATGRPYPGAFTRLGGADLRIWAAAPSDMGGRHAALPGQVVARTADGFTVLCGQATALIVTQWSGPDKPPKLHAILGD
ncbi:MULTISPECIES: formyltransferase family protein [unclassified Sphingobium]|uniref:formyltransferase family protein n=1 Tax=unclassified Sphingobium TaxID=2611147 RepID=UPI00065C80F3|nr:MULTISPECIES: formyltransferase family protein [unclassified Sphingobium]OAP32153.1 methionyl-tRNA formyltransferase [Sphingobium sp. 20006FA]KXU32795.1 methionyl-tRNA formyltransferase [Sphingobium sp. AM]KYC32876.1 methionyl-tRNA formyltransferase [Sphingobium sp. 22B]MCB4859928.1 methionyl-tRNA formyltransferase [Sphingobium sp. PNB]UXC90080.1 formyltransferase family protein [Sphingobium sp. RSMS]